MNRHIQILEKQIDIAPLVYARIVLGILIALEFSGGLFTSYADVLIDTQFHFSYFFTPFIEPWSSTMMMKGHFVLNFILGILFAAGFYFRWVTPLFMMSGASLFLMEKTLYINHFYLYSLILLLFNFIPANRAFSYDAWRKPEIKVSQVPAWTLYIILFQISIMYFYAGLAKINLDWLEARPLKVWLSNKADYPLIGDIISSTFHAYFVAYGGLLFDLLIVPFMLYSKTRKITFVICCFFHLANVVTFGVGTFPWFSMAATALFFAPSSFRKFLPKLPQLGFKTYDYGNKMKFIYPLLVGFFLVQLLVPLRQHLYQDNPSWTEQGHYFAWRMMLRSKQSSITFTVHDSTSAKKENVNLKTHLHPKQIKKMGGHPDMILQFAHYLEDYYAKHKEYVDPQVYANNKVSLNGRKHQSMVDETVDLAREIRTLKLYDWVMPLEKK